LRFGLTFTIYDNNGNEDTLQRKEVTEWREENQNETTTTTTTTTKRKIGETK